MSACRKCGKAIVFAVVDNKEGKPPSRMPLDPVPTADGNVAVNRDVTGRLIGHVLSKGEEPLGYQRLFMPHFATCEKRETPPPAETPSNPGAKQEPSGVTFLDQWRKARSANAAAKRGRRGKRAAAQTYLGHRRNP